MLFFVIWKTYHFVRASTNGHKRACLERVLQANPENAYARASLVRLQNTPKTDTGALEHSLGLVSSDYALTP